MSKTIFILISLSIFIRAQIFYYNEGKKIYFEERPNQFVLLLNDNVTEKEVKAFLSRNNLITTIKSIGSKYLLLEPSGISKSQIKTLLKSNNLGQFVTNVYSIINKPNKFTVTDKIIIKLKSQEDPNVLNIITGNYNLKKIDEDWLGDNVYLLQLSEMDENLTISVANEIYKSGLVEFSHPDFVTFNWAESGTNDTYYGSQWNLTKIMAPNAWDISTGSSSIIIAILDAGVQSNHPDLDDHLVTGYDVVDNDYTTDPYNNYYHGTFCAGIASAETNNGTGIAGVGYNCKIMPIQFTHTTDWGNSSNFAAGINYAANHGAQIISISGSTNPADAVYNAINSAVTNGRNGKGCVIVKSAGNTYEEDITYPGEHPEIICVGATDFYDNKCDFSSYGAALDVMAPSNVYTTDLTGSAGKSSTDYYSSFEGTSAAAPQVAGLAGLMLSYNNTLTETIVRKIISYSSDDIGVPNFDNETGWGRINAWRALDAINHTTTNGTLPRDEIWWVTVNLTGNVTVPSGVKLTILSGATINLNGHSIISTGGTITKEAGATINGLRAKLEANTVLRGLCCTIQTAANYAAQDNEIILANGNFNEDVSISNKSDLRIQGSSSDYSHFGNLTITACNYFQGLDFGAKSIYVNNSNYASICRIYADGINQITIGLHLYDSDADVYNIVATYSQAGVSCYDGTEADISQSALTYNLRGLETYNGSNANIDTSWFCGTALDLKAYNFSSIYAYYCYFDGGTPSISQSSSTVQHVSDQNCPLSKVSSNQQTENNNYVVSTNDIEGSEFEKINSSYFSLNEKLINAFKEKTAFDKEEICTEYEKVIADFKEFIRNNPDSPLAKIAFTASAKSYRRIDDLREKSDFSDIKNFLTDVIENGKYPAIKPQAERLMIDYYRSIKDYAGAVKTADNLIEKYKDDPDYVCGVLYSKGLILAHDLNQPEQATECFSLILQKYPENCLAALAENELEILGIEIKNPKEKTLAENDQEFSTSSYPNPFNPTTTITFSLPKRNNVKLIVYDVLGREIIKLADGIYEAGEHKIEFNASNLASGVYFYRIEAGNFSQTKKLVLTK